MSIRLDFSFGVEFDSEDTARAFAVALGWAINGVVENARHLSESPAPRIERGRFEVTPSGAPRG